MQKLFADFIDINSKDIVKPLFRLFSFAAVCIIAVIAVAVVIQDSEYLGTWGDYFGGTLNPLLTFLTFVGLLMTIVMQHKEMKDSRKEFKRSADALNLQNDALNRQIFEATFFQMLSLHNTIVNTIRIEHNKQALNGRECFNGFYTQLSDIYKRNSKKVGAPYYGDEQATIEQAFKVFWRVQQRNLGHYYRYLYNVVRFVAESNYRNGQYIRLVRAQLSDQECLMLFYNCLTKQGKNFKTFAEEFSLFDNLDPKQLLNSQHRYLVEPNAFGNKEEK